MTQGNVTVESMHKLTFLTLVTIFLTAACISIIQPAKASVEEVATSVSITIQPKNVTQGQPFTVIVQIYPPPPSNTDIFYNIFVIVTSPAQGISGYGPWSAGPSSSDSNGITNFTFPGTISATTAGGWDVEVRFPGQFFGNNTIYHYQAGDWQQNFIVSSPLTPSPSPTKSATPPPSTTTLASPTIPELTCLVILPLFVFLLLVAGILRRKKLRLEES